MKNWEEAAKIIKSNKHRYFDLQTDFARAAGMSERTCTRKINQPATLALSEFRQIARVTHMSDEDILAIIK